MSTLTITVSDETARRVAADPERLAHVARMIEVAYGVEPEPIPISKELADELQAMCDGIEAGTIKTTPHDRAKSLAHAEELLKVAGLV
jgi:CO/xanthine dehydrogenase Mo-binding subunit